VHTSRAATAYREWVTDYDNTVRNYYARITGVDAAVGMIRKELEQQGLAQNTVIIFHLRQRLQQRLARLLRQGHPV